MVANGFYDLIFGYETCTALRKCVASRVFKHKTICKTRCAAQSLRLQQMQCTSSLQIHIKHILLNIRDILVKVNAVQTPTSAYSLEEITPIFFISPIPFIRVHLWLKSYLSKV